MRFNQSQSRAIDHFRGPSLVLAGPGSGKTAVITYRVKNLIEKYHIPPCKILVLTFSKAAAREMEERFFSLQTTGVKKENCPVFGTFHGFFFSVLRSVDNNGQKKVLSSAKKRMLLQEECIRLHIDQEEDSFWETLEHEISRIKSGLAAAASSSILPPESFQLLFEAYEAALSANQLLDFDDILSQTLELLSLRKDILSSLQDHFSFFLIDEFQDVSQIQYSIMNLLAERERNLFAVGDDDQSIYAFRGASAGIMKQFLLDYPEAERILLNVNYRNAAPIIRSALKVISGNPDRFRKEILCPSNAGDPDAFSLREEENLESEYFYVAEKISSILRQGIRFDQIAILLRSTTDLSLLRRILLQQGIPVKEHIASDPVFDSFLCKDMTSYMKIASSLSGQISKEKGMRGEFLRILNRPSRFLSRQALPDNDSRPESVHSFFSSLSKYYSFHAAASERIARFKEDLVILSSCSPYAAISYIWNRVGYKEYIKEYCRNNHKDYSAYEKMFSALLAASEGLVSFRQWEELLQEKAAELSDTENNGVHIMTIHASKGLEFDTVFLPDLNEGLLPHKKAPSPEQIQEERRLLYVAMTRARSRLLLSYVRDYHNKKATRSRFLDCFF